MSKGIISITAKGLTETINKLKDVEEAIKHKATLSAINKTATQTRNYSVRLIRKEYMLSSGDLKDKIIISKATKNLLQAKVISIKKNGALLITKFSARMTKKGLSVKVKKQGKRAIIQGGFITPAGLPFKRYGEKDYAPKRGYWAGKRIKRGLRAGEPILRQRIKQIYGPSVADIFGSTAIFDDLIKFSQKKLVEIFINELQFYTRKHFGK